jgi:hypothetical protein
MSVLRHRGCLAIFQWGCGVRHKGTRGVLGCPRNRRRACACWEGAATKVHPAVRVRHTALGKYNQRATTHGED